MGNSQRQKGQRGERELAKWLQEVVGFDIDRNLQQTRAGGADIICIPGLSIEVKRQQTLTIESWWLQARRQAVFGENIPVLAYRPNRAKWRFCLPFYLMHKEAPPEYYITLGLKEFKMWLEEFLRCS